MVAPQNLKWRTGLIRLLGDKDAADGVARTARSLYYALLADLPSDGAQLRLLVALQARHTALAAYYTEQAGLAGLATAEGIALVERATRDGSRAETLAKTVWEIARKLKSAAPADVPDLSTVIEVKESR